MGEDLQTMNRSKLSIHITHCRYFMILVCIGIVLSFSMRPQPALASDYADSQNLNWHYTMRPNDTLQEVSSRLLRPPHKWTDLAHHNNIKSPKALQLGSIIKVPIAWLKFQPKPATTAALEGVALLKRRQDTTFSVLKESNLIYVGDEVLTRDGSVVIKFADDTTLSLGRFSHIIFNKLSHYGEIGMVDTRMRLNKGGLETKVSPLLRGSRYEISTPTAVAAVRGTQFRLRTTDKGTTLEVLEGNVEFSHQHGRTLVPAGKGARIHAQSAVLQTKRLLPAPSANFSDPDTDKLPLTLSWQGLSNANSYQYEVRKEDGELVEQQVSGAPEITLDNLPDGDYELAMAAVDNDGFQGMKSSTKLDIEAGPDKALLSLPLPGSILDSFSAEFSWELNNPATMSKLELSRDENFDSLALRLNWSTKKHLRLESELPPGTYYWRVRSLSIGKTESVSTHRTVSIQGLLDPIKILTVNYIGEQVGIFWHSVDHANGYTLQISDDDEFRRLLKEETLGKTSAYIKLAPGKHYFARVKGLGNDIFGSEFGPPKEIFLAENKSTQQQK
jgi:hypothetical protein